MNRPRLSKDAVALTVLILAALALALASLARRPDIYNSGAVLIGDPSYNLLVADRLLDGASLLPRLKQTQP